MSPERAAGNLAKLGAALLALALLLRVLSLANTFVLSRRAPPEQPYAAVPYVGGYTFSPSGAQVSFQQGWVPTGSTAGGRKDNFYLDLRTGLFTPGKLPPADTRPFVFRENRLWLENEGSPAISGSPPDMQVEGTSLALSPDGSMIAFVAVRYFGDSTLFVLSKAGHIIDLVRAYLLTKPDWSPDGQALAFAMREMNDRQAGIQIYRVQRDGSGLRQLTRGSWLATQPRWSPDGRSIAYFQQSLSSKSSGTDIYLMDASGADPRQITQDGGLKNSLSWVAGTRRLVYTTSTQDWSLVEALIAVDADGANPQPARFYPPVSVEALECPKTLPRGGSGVVRITLLNSGPQPVAIPLVLRAGAEPVQLVSIPVSSPDGSTPQPAPDIPAQQNQLIALTGGERRSVDLPASPVSGLATYLSVLAVPDGQFPVSEKHCAVRNTYFGLPNLRYLPSTFPLAASGMLLMAPWLRQRRKAWRWALWLAVPLVLAVLIVLESQNLPPLT